jgi:predicted NACHT family NTPase
MDHPHRSYLEWIRALCAKVPFSGVHVMRDVAPPALDDIFVELTVRKELRRRPRVFHEEVDSSLDVSDQTDTVGSTSTLSPPTGGASPSPEYWEYQEYMEYLEARESPPMSIQQALAEARRCVLLGGPGSGKSTLVRHLAFSLCAWLLAPDKQPCAYRQLQGLVPVPVLLRHFAKRLLEHPELSLAGYLRNYNMQDLVLGSSTR